MKVNGHKISKWWLVPLVGSWLGIGYVVVSLTNSATPDPISCSGYPEPRTFVEVQSWWQEPGVVEPMHAHAGTCFPLGQNMSGTSTFDVRVMLHRSPGTYFALSFDMYNGQSQYINVPDQTCGIGNDCTYWTTVTVNWSNTTAGWQELRLKARVQFPPSFDTDPGATQITSSGWPVQVRGGTGGQRSSCQTNKTTCYTESRGWYEHRGYQNVQVWDYRQFIGAGKVWSGVKLVPVKMGSNYPSGEDTPTTRSYATLDPAFHVGNPGTQIMSKAGKYNSKSGDPYLRIDTTSLSNGLHKLVLLSESAQPNHPTPGTLTGVGVYEFMVAN